MPWFSMPGVQVVEELRSREVLRCAVLDDGSTWVLVSVDHIQVCRGAASGRVLVRKAMLTAVGQEALMRGG